MKHISSLIGGNSAPGRGNSTYGDRYKTAHLTLELQMGQKCSLSSKRVRETGAGSECISEPSVSSGEAGYKMAQLPISCRVWERQLRTRFLE